VLNFFTIYGEKNKHSVIESNINELENRGLDRCLDVNFVT